MPMSSMSLLNRTPPMLKDEASALLLGARLAYDHSVNPPTPDPGVPPTTAYDAWSITSDSTMAEAAFGIPIRYFIAPNITSGYWKNRGAVHIRRFSIPRANQEIRDPLVSYKKPTLGTTPPTPDNPGFAAALNLLQQALLVTVKAVEGVEYNPAPVPTPPTSFPPVLKKISGPPEPLDHSE